MKKCMCWCLSIIIFVCMIEYYIYSKHSNMSDVTSKFQTARVKLTYKEVPKTVFIGTAISLQYV